MVLLRSATDRERHLSSPGLLIHSAAEGTLAPRRDEIPPCWHTAGAITVGLRGRLDGSNGAGAAAAVARAYGDDREAGLVSLAGPFAAIVIDRSDPGAPSVQLYRDLSGRETLYFRATSESLWAAPDVLPLLRLLDEDPEPDEQQLHRFFALQPPQRGHTALRGIDAVGAGELVRWEGGQLRRQQQGRLRAADLPRSFRTADYVAEFRRLLRQAVARSLPPDGVPTGIMLSGGLDSGGACVEAAPLLAGRNQGLAAYSWSLPGFPEADESAAIAAVACRTNTRFVPIPATESVALDGLGSWHADPAWPAGNLVRGLKARVYEVASGDGCGRLINCAHGDRLYPDYALLLADTVARGEFGRALRFLLAALRSRGPVALGSNPALRTFLRRALGRHPRPWARDWLTAASAEAVTSTRSARNIGELRASQVANVSNTWATDGLPSENLHARAHGLEVVDPYRDPDLISYMLAVPVHVVYRDGQGKWIAREALRGALPEPVRVAPRTGVLTNYVAAGLRCNEQLLRAVLLREEASWDRYVAREWVRAALDANLPDDRARLVAWGCFTYELWLAALRAGDWRGTTDAHPLMEIEPRALIAGARGPRRPHQHR